MVDDPPDHAVVFHLAKLLDQHLLGNRRNSPLQLREAQDLPAEEMEQDEELPSSFEHFERLLHVLRGGDGRIFLALTLGCVPYFFVRSCHSVSVSPSLITGNPDNRERSR